MMSWTIKSEWLEFGWTTLNTCFITGTNKVNKTKTLLCSLYKCSSNRLHHFHPRHWSESHRCRVTDGPQEQIKVPQLQVVCWQCHQQVLEILHHAWGRLDPPQGRLLLLESRSQDLRNECCQVLQPTFIRNVLFDGSKWIHTTRWWMFGSAEGHSRHCQLQIDRKLVRIWRGTPKTCKDWTLPDFARKIGDGKMFCFCGGRGTILDFWKV